MTDAEIEARLVMLRRHGVKSFTGGDVVGALSVEFFPAAPVDAPATKAVDEDVCRCGHKNYEHGPLCLHGCDPVKCAPEETA